MILLYILGAIIAVVLLLSTLPLTVVVTAHSKKGVVAKAGFPPFFYFTLYPTYEDAFTKKELLDGSDDEALAAYMAKILNTYLPKEATKRKKSSSTSELIDVTKLVGKIFFTTVERWHFIIKRCHITVGTEDAAETAYLYGGVSAGVSYLVALIDKFTKKEPSTKNILISADFEAKETTLDICVHARVNLSGLLLQYIRVITKKSIPKASRVNTQKG